MNDERASALPAPTRAPAGGRLRIHAVAAMTGVSAATLRAWERRYQVPKPSRSAAAYRLYSEHDVRQVEHMRALCGSGHSAAEAAELVLRSSLSRVAAITTDPAATVRAELVAAARCYDVAAVEAGLHQALCTSSASLLYEQVVAPVLHEVGELWRRGEITVAQEHLLTDVVETTLRHLLRLVQPRDPRRLVLLAAFADETHALGLYGVGLRFAGWGYRVVSLGAQVPPDALAEAVAALKPDLVGLSCVVYHGPADAALAKAYGAACGKVPWMVGGPGAQPMQETIVQAGGMLAGRSLEDVRRQVEG